MRIEDIKYFIGRVESIFGNIFDFSKTEYVNREVALMLICKKCKCEFETKPRHIYYISTPCPKCRQVKISKKNTLNTQEFTAKALKIHGNKYNYSKVKYKNCSIPVKIWCNECEKYFWQKPKYHLQGSGCQICKSKATSSRLQLSTYDFICNAKKLHNEDYCYDDTNYVNARTKVKIKCNKCANFLWIRPDAHVSGGGCSCSGESIGEKCVKNYLKSHKINFIRNKKFDGCKRIRKLSYDFYLPYFNILIEYDGRQHFYPFFCDKIDEDKSKEVLALQKESDEIKTKFANGRGMKLIRIKYTQIKEIDAILDFFLIYKI